MRPKRLISQLHTCGHVLVSSQTLPAAASDLHRQVSLHHEFERVQESGPKDFLDRVSASQHSVVMSHSRESVLSDTAEKGANY